MCFCCLLSGLVKIDEKNGEVSAMKLFVLLGNQKKIGGKIFAKIGKGTLTLCTKSKSLKLTNKTTYVC